MPRCRTDEHFLGEQVERLLKDPTKEVHIPQGPREKQLRPPKEMIKNVSGSSAGVSHSSSSHSLPAISIFISHSGTLRTIGGEWRVPCVQAEPTERVRTTQIDGREGQSCKLTTQTRNTTMPTSLTLTKTKSRRFHAL